MTETTTMTLSDMKAQMSKAKKKNLTVSKEFKEKQKKDAKKAMKVSTDVKPKKAKTEPKPKAEKKVIDKAANLQTLKKSVSKAFGKKFTITESNRVSKYGGMLKVQVNSTKASFEVWDELEVNDRICIFAGENSYDTYKAQLSNNQRDNCIIHPNWKLSRQFYVMRNDIESTLKAIATGCETLVKS